MNEKEKYAKLVKFVDHMYKHAVDNLEEARIEFPDDVEAIKFWSDSKGAFGLVKGFVKDMEA